MGEQYIFVLQYGANVTFVDVEDSVPVDTDTGARALLNATQCDRSPLSDGINMVLTAPTVVVHRLHWVEFADALTANHELNDGRRAALARAPPTLRA